MDVDGLSIQDTRNVVVGKATSNFFHDPFNLLDPPNAPTSSSRH